MNPIKELKEEARKHGIFIQAICDEAGIHQSQASRWLNGKVMPLYDSVTQMREAFERLKLQQVRELVDKALAARDRLEPSHPDKTEQTRPETS